MNSTEQDYAATVEGKSFDDMWVSEFKVIIQIPDIPVFEKLALELTSDFEYRNDKSRRIYNLCGWSSQIAQLFMEFQKHK